jgi:hypothetical protein
MFSSIKNFYIDSFYGRKAPLHVFLIGYLLPKIILLILIDFLTRSKILNVLFILSILEMIFLYWAAVSLWRCAKNTKDRFSNFLTKFVSFILTANLISGIYILIFWH